MSRQSKLMGVFVVCMGLLVMCSEPSSDRARKVSTSASDYRDRGYLRDVEQINQHWTDAAQVALASSRLSLAGPVSDLQAIRRDLRSLQPGPCTADAHEALLRLHDRFLESMLSFMSKGSRASFDDQSLLDGASRAKALLDRCR